LNQSTDFMNVYPSVYTYTDFPGGSPPYTIVANSTITTDGLGNPGYTPIDTSIASFDIPEYCPGATGTNGATGGGGGGGGGFTQAG